MKVTDDIRNEEVFVEAIQTDQSLPQNAIIEKIRSIAISLSDRENSSSLHSSFKISASGSAEIYIETDSKGDTKGGARVTFSW